MNKLLLFVGITMLSSACSFNIGTTNTATTPPANAAVNANKPGNAATPTPTATQAKSAEPSCSEQKLPGKRFIKSQTFPIDFKPFEGGCFTTFASTEDMLDEKDVPRGSTFYVYKDGKQVYEFPDAFGGQPACWVEAVSFKDLNGDGLTDVILAGSCLAAKSGYPSNAIYVNKGNEFETDAEANAKLDELSKVKDIESYVKAHLKDFF